MNLIKPIFCPWFKCKEVSKDNQKECSNQKKVRCLNIAVGVNVVIESPTLVPLASYRSASSSSLIPPPSDCPHSPLVRIHRYGPRLAQLGGYQHFPLPAVSRGNRDALVARVRPVDVLVDPVDREALGGVERVDERHLLRRVTGLVDVSTGGRERRGVWVSVLEKPWKIQ